MIGPAARAQAGFRGAIAAQFLKRAGDVSYIVQRDAPALSIPGGEYSIAGKPIRLAKTPTGIFGRPGGYRVNRCCNAQTLKSDSIIGSMVNAVADNITAYRIGHAESPPEGCRDNYVFEIMSPQLTCVEKTIELAGPTCDRFVSNLRPVANDQLESVFALSRLTGRGPESSEFIDSEGLYKLPKDPRTEQRPFGGLNAWRNPVSERSPANNSDLNYDSFMDPMAACAYMRVLQAWQKTCNQPGCQIQDNDAYHPPSWRGHQSHGKKTCLDIFPLSKSARGPGSITFSSPNYDRERTMKLIETLINAGAERSQLGFSDPVAVKRFGTKPWAGHQNHIHVCFPTSPEAAESARVRKTCLDGVSPSGAPAAKTLVTPKTTFEEATARAAGAIGYFNFLSPQCQ
ncbi:MAG: hypothetical protein EOP05_15080 [Proteobacteria bacterium]|nr:MAG: hypothetical protein EOP05_15080 [Pseudomonadota bacterium]